MRNKNYTHIEVFVDLADSPLGTKGFLQLIEFYFRPESLPPILHNVKHGAIVEGVGKVDVV